MYHGILARAIGVRVYDCLIHDMLGWENCKETSVSAALAEDMAVLVTKY